MSIQQLGYAAELIKLACGEERADGNPMTAAKYYSTALEIIIAEAVRYAATIQKEDVRLFFFFQLRAKLEVYYKRAELLLQVANGSGLLDKPNMNGGSINADLMSAAVPRIPSYPPALFGSTATVAKVQGGDGDMCKKPPSTSVLGIPLQLNQAPAMPSLSGNATPTAGGGSGAAEPPISCYLKADDDDGTAAPPPPITSELDLDELMKNLGAPPGS